MFKKILIITFILLSILVCQAKILKFSSSTQPQVWPPDLIAEGILPPAAEFKLLNFKGFWSEQDWPTDAETGDYYISKVESPHFHIGDFLVKAPSSWSAFSFRGDKGRGILSISAKPNNQDPYKIDIAFKMSDGKTITITTPNIRGQRGERGIKGDTGKQGPKGDTGPAGKDGRVQGLTSKDATVKIDMTDPANPDLSVQGANPNKLIGFDLPKEIKPENNGQILAVDYTNKRWIFVDNKGGGGNSFGQILINGTGPIKATQPNDAFQINSDGNIVIEPDYENKTFTIKD